MDGVQGIHHITAVAADAKENLEFYRDVLGLRLVKKTINFDDPSAYHLYYGNELGSPGTLLTFFIWDVPHGHAGVGQVGPISLSIPQGSAGYWKKRLDGNDFPFKELERFGEKSISFQDFDGLPIELTESADDRTPWVKGGVPMKHAIRGVHGITLDEEQLEATQSMLELLGFKLAKKSENRYRFMPGGNKAVAQSLVDVMCEPDALPAVPGSGTVHHVAFRTPGSSEQEAWQAVLEGMHVPVTPIMERKYFQSIYFREEGGVLFEIATDGPGFGVDEPFERLGETLSLPESLDEDREKIEEGLPPLGE